MSINETTNLFEIEYNISLEDYIDFNFLLLKDIISKGKKQSLINGVLMVILSVILSFISIYSKRYNNILLNLIIISVLGLGIFALFFYTSIFPNNIKKNSHECYYKSRFSKGAINLKFYQNFLTESSSDGNLDIPWESFDQFYSNNNIVILGFNINHLIIIPKNKISAQLMDFINHNYINKN